MARAKKEEKVDVINLSDLKDELKEYITDEVKKQIPNEVDRTNKKLLR